MKSIRDIRARKNKLNEIAITLQELGFDYEIAGLPSFIAIPRTA